MKTHLLFLQTVIGKLLCGIIVTLFLSDIATAQGNFASVKEIAFQMHESKLDPLLVIELQDAGVRQLFDAVDVTVTGTVLDQKGSPIPGVTVSVPGTVIGTATDLEGKYSITVPEGATLVFSFIGFVTQEVEVGDQSNINIQLEEDISALDEVVVIGYGTQKKSSVTAAISTLSGDAITQNPVANLNNSIAGRVPGVLSFQASGEPGADAANIRIRGLGTIGSNSSALTIVDGVPRSFSQINPNEIENTATHPLS
jgi:hypothetical protein